MAYPSQKTSTHDYKDKKAKSDAKAKQDIAWLRGHNGIDQIIDHKDCIPMQDIGVDFTVYSKSGKVINVEHKFEDFTTGRIFLETIANEEKEKPGCLLTTQSDEVMFSYPTGVSLFLPTKELQRFMADRECFYEHSFHHRTSTGKSGCPLYHTIGRIVSWPRLFMCVPGTRSRVTNMADLLKARGVEGLEPICDPSAAQNGIHATNSAGHLFYISASLSAPGLKFKTPNPSPESAKEDLRRAGDLYVREPGLFDSIDDKQVVPLCTIRESKADFYIHIFPGGDVYIDRRERMLEHIDKNEKIARDSQQKSPRMQSILDFIQGTAGMTQHKGRLLSHERIAPFLAKLTV